MDPFALPLVQRQLEVSSGKTKAVLWLGLLLSSVRALWSELRSKVLLRECVWLGKEASGSFASSPTRLLQSDS
ncbi:hypothetical protein LINPERHAP2_LOCUS403 [Linum perenne]